MTLRPASVDCFNLELLACLTLSAPTGMDRDLRIEWIKVARQTIGDLPEDLLKEGCAEARKRADHPAKIVPIIMQTVEGAMRQRRNMQPIERVPAERRIEPHYVKPESAADILATVAPSFAGIGSKVERPHRAPPRVPTDADYRAMGIDPAIATEARRAETGTGSVHDGAGPQDIAQAIDNTQVSHSRGEG